MKFAKYNDYTNTPETTVVTDTGGSSSSNVLNRTLWGNADNGTDLDESIFISGSIYLSGYEDEDTRSDDDDDDDYDDENDEDNLPQPYADDPGGNIYGGNNLEFKTGEFSENIYSNEVYLNYPNSAGEKTNILEIFRHLVPVGTILPYAGTENKTTLRNWGWAVCDGTTTGVPDLRDRFLRGGQTAGQTGGSSSITLSVNEMPAHSHTATSISTSTVTTGSVVTGGTTSYSLDGEGFRNNIVTDLTTGDLNVSTTTDTTIGNTGGGNSFSIIPPYYTVVYIMRIA